MTSPETDLDMLLRYLRAQRQHVLAAFDGLDDAQWRLGVLPSGWSPLSLVHHLTIDVERWWFQAIVAGDRHARADIESSDGWNPPELAVTEIVERYVAAARRSDEIAQSAGIYGDLAWWPDGMPRHRRNVMDVVLHVTAETAAHAGHADAAAELIDGRQWLVLT